MDQEKAKEMAEQINDSHVYAGIVTESFLKNPTCALQLGYAILLDKPIMLIVDKECKIPEGLVKVAKLIEKVDVKNKGDLQRASESLQHFADKFNKP